MTFRQKRLSDPVPSFSENSYRGHLDLLSLCSKPSTGIDDIDIASIFQTSRNDHVPFLVHGPNARSPGCLNKCCAFKTTIFEGIGIHAVLCLRFEHADSWQDLCSVHRVNILIDADRKGLRLECILGESAIETEKKRLRLALTSDTNWENCLKFFREEKYSCSPPIEWCCP